MRVGLPEQLARHAGDRVTGEKNPGYDPRPLPRAALLGDEEQEEQKDALADGLVKLARMARQRAASGKTIAQGTSVGRPYSSPLMKLAMRPKKRPIGIASMTMSEKARSRYSTGRANSMIAIVTPSAPPWNDIPPCHT